MGSELIDLHVHSTTSDGTFTPQEIVRLAVEVGLQAIALTDHDTVDGVEAAVAAGREAGLEVVPGVELSVDYNGEMHILGYFINPRNSQLQENLNLLRRFRDQRNPKMAAKLQELGFAVTMDEVSREAAGGVVGRPHFASVMLKKGYVKDFSEAFDLYLGAGKKAYVKKERLSPQEGIALIAASGGIPVLAHPKYIKVEDGGLEGLIEELKGYGLKGIEVFYTTHTAEETECFLDLARQKELLITGGTDFHGGNKREIQLGKGEGNLAIPYELLAKMKEQLS